MYERGKGGKPSAKAHREEQTPLGGQDIRPLKPTVQQADEQATRHIDDHRHQREMSKIARRDPPGQPVAGHATHETTGSDAQQGLPHLPSSCH